MATIGALAAAGFHQLGESGEMVIDIEAIDLLAHGALHINRRVDNRGRRRIGPAISVQRNLNGLVGRSLALHYVFYLIPRRGGTVYLYPEYSPFIYARSYACRNAGIPVEFLQPRLRRLGNEHCLKPISLTSVTASTQYLE
ncbi:hypothetical protein [Rhodoblastus sp.]|uniref:hypothetical protein n=1 Tax=Rhodoblastus sp. TaxID=1962975 RepID=UPI003F9CE4C3